MSTCEGMPIVDDDENQNIVEVRHCPGCAEAASLREHLADLRNELSYWRTNLAAAESQALASREALEHERASHGETVKLMRDYRRQLMDMEDVRAERDELRGLLTRAWAIRKHCAECVCVTCEDVRKAIPAAETAPTPLPVPACGAIYCSDGNAGGHGGVEFSECGRPRGHEGLSGDIPGTKCRRRPQPGDGPVTAPTTKET